MVYKEISHHFLLVLSIELPKSNLPPEGAEINYSGKIICYAPPVIHSVNIYEMQQLVSLYFDFFVFCFCWVFLLSRRKAIKRITTTKEIA